MQSSSSSSTLLTSTKVRRQVERQTLDKRTLRRTFHSVLERPNKIPDNEKDFVQMRCVVPTVMNVSESQRMT